MADRWPPPWSGAGSPESHAIEPRPVQPGPMDPDDVAQPADVQAVPPPELSAMCKCSHHWFVHAESGRTARSAVCHGYVGSATPGPLYEPCRCTGFAPWAGPRDSRTGEPVKPLTMTVDARVKPPATDDQAVPPPDAVKAAAAALRDMHAPGLRSEANHAAALAMYLPDATAALAAAGPVIAAEAAQAASLRIVTAREMVATTIRHSGVLSLTSASSDAPERLAGAICRALADLLDGTDD